MTTVQIAKVCHEVNRAYCQALGDDSQVPWSEAPAWQKDSAVNGARMHLLDLYATASAGHEAWMAEKIAAGWTYGGLKDEQAKTHPCMVPFDQLPREQQAKDFIFRAVVHALAPYCAVGVVESADAGRKEGTDAS